MRKKIAVINGPNMNLLGKREPSLYGIITLEEINDNLRKLGEELSCDLIFAQSNYEGEIVDFIQKNMECIDGIVINPAGFSKTGYCILDALEAVDIPYIEVHMTNIFNRGEKHRDTVFHENAVGVLVGLKENVYNLGVRGIVEYLDKL